ICYRSTSAAANSSPIYIGCGHPVSVGSHGAAELAARRLEARYQGIKVAGASSPPFPFDAKAGDITGIRAALTATQPKIVFVGLGFPKQERLIARLCGHLPRTWFVAGRPARPHAAGQMD